MLTDVAIFLSGVIIGTFTASNIHFISRFFSIDEFWVGVDKGKKMGYGIQDRKWRKRKK